MKRAIIVVLIAAAAGGVWWRTSAAKKGRGGEGRGRVVAAELGPIDSTIEATGSVMPRNRVEIKPPVSGRVDKLLVEEGDRVSQSQLVAWISSSDRNAILDAARAQGPEQLKKWEDAYKPTAVFASLPGEVILKNVVVGQGVDAGTVIYAVADTLIVTAQVDESDIGKIRTGQRVRIRLDSYPDEKVEGKVYDILYEGKNNSNVITYGVKVAPVKVPAYFRSQMTANVSFVVAEKKEAVLVPPGALKDAAGGKRVVTLAPKAEGEEPTTREVKVGVETDDKVEILTGLKAGEKVLVSQGRYAAEKAPESSPLSFMNRGMGRKPGEGAAPKPKRGASGAAATMGGSAQRQ